MAFIAPDLVKAAIEGRLPRGISTASLRDAPAEWSHQMKRLGLSPADPAGHLGLGLGDVACNVAGCDPLSFD